MAATRIFHVPRRFVAEEWGGTETVLASLALEQARQGLHPEIHTSLALSTKREDAWRGIPIRRYPYCYPFFGLDAAGRAQMDRKGGNLLSFSLLAALATAPDVRLFHAHALKRLGGEVFTAARWQGKPFVVTLHGGVFDVPAAELAQMQAPQKGRLEWGKPFGALFRSRRLLEEADAVICVGHSEAEKARHQLSHDRIYHVGNGVDPDRFAQGNGAAFRAKHGLPPDALVLACYSRIDPQKDQLTLVRAFTSLASEFPQLHLVLAGPVTVPEFAREIDAALAASPHGHRTRRLPALSFAEGELTDAYHACDIFVLPSRHEPFGIVVLEAWSAGRPVVVSAVGGLQDLVADGRDGLFFPAGDAAACTDRLRGLLRSAAQRVALAEAGQAKARRDYAWPVIAERTEALYQRAEDRVRSRPRA